MSTKQHPELPVQEDELNMIQQIRKELSLEDPGDAIRLIASVLQALRQTLSLERANKLLNMLPDFLKVIFASGWQRTEKNVEVNHLDEFVTLVMDRDARDKRGLFRNEVQTLSVVILTLKLLNKITDLQRIDGLSPLLLQELRELPSEAAA